MVADGDGRTADAPAQQVRRQQEAQHQRGQRQQVQPVAEVQRQAQRHVRGVDAQALAAAGPGLQPLPARHAGQHHAHGEGGHRQVHRRQAQHRQAEQEAHHQAHRAGQGHHPPVRQAGVHDQQRRHIGANGVEGAVAQRDLAVVADQDVHAQQRHRVDQHVGQPEELEIGDEQRHGRGGGQQRQQADGTHRAGQSGGRHQRQPPAGLARRVPAVTPASPRVCTVAPAAAIFAPTLVGE